MAGSIASKDKQIKFKYSLDVPQIEVNYLDVCKLALVFKSSNSEEELE